MKKSRFSETQIIAVLHEWDAGATVVDLVRRRGMTEQTLYRCKKKYGGMPSTEAKRLKTLEEANRQLKRLVADHALNLPVVKPCWGNSGDTRSAADGRPPRDADRRVVGASSMPLHGLCALVAAIPVHS